MGTPASGSAQRVSSARTAVVGVGPSAGSARCRRIFRTTCGSERSARTTIAASQRGHCKASRKKTRRSSWAQGKDLRWGLGVGGSGGEFAGVVADTPGDGSGCDWVASSSSVRLLGGAGKMQRDFRRGMQSPGGVTAGARRNLGLFRLVGSPDAKTLREINRHLETVAELMWQSAGASGDVISLAWVMAPVARRGRSTPPPREARARERS